MSIAELTSEVTQYAPEVVTVVPVLGGESPTVLASQDLGIDTERLRRLGVTGKAGTTTRVLVSGSDATEAAVVLTGLGDERSAESLRRAAGLAARSLHDEADVAYDLDDATDDEIEALFIGHLLGGYRFEQFLGTGREDTPIDQRVGFAGATSELIDRVATIADNVRITRDLVNTPPSNLVPEDFAAAVTELVGETDVDVEVWDESRLADEGCGGILGVGRGSENPPCAVRLSYHPDGATAHVALVGKGITFDSGGLSLKPAASMVGMKFDMSGAASVVGTIRAVAQLGVPVAVTGWCMLAENMPSGSAIKPDDVLTTRSGQTVEVTNTDAEGRLVLCDGIALASEQQPDCIIDIATLTGAAIIALGDRTTGLVANNDDWAQRALDAASVAGEPLWRMPIPEEIDERLKSNVADMVNSKPGDRSAGMLFAAAFLQRFVGKTDEGDALPWLHLDIAGPAESDCARGYVAKGATGVPVRTLITLLERLAEGAN